MNAITVLEPAESMVEPSRDAAPLYEIIDGRKVELPPMSIRATRVASRLHLLLGHYCASQHVGETVMEGLFHLPLRQDRNRRPDVAYLSTQRVAQAAAQPEDDNAWDAVPDLVVEVVSPTELADELMRKVEDYFQAGVRMVWVVYPRDRIIQIYESLTQIRGLTQADELHGDPVLPGFRLKVAELF